MVDPIREVEAIHGTNAYLYEAPVGSIRNKPQSDDEIFTFQYWPESIQDTYEPNYEEMPIPGGSHPLYQYVGGGARNISFTATFTSEIKDQSNIQDGTNAKYSVDVRAAIARLQRYLYPKYRKGGLLGVTEAPPRLVLVLTNTNLGRDQDEILVILRSAPVSYTHWFPDGTPRVAQLDLEFSEIVQTRQDNNRTKVNFIGSKRYEGVAKRYRSSIIGKPDGAVRHGG